MKLEDIAKIQTRTSCRLGEPKANPELERQAVAGEEDQSQAGWDDGP